MGTIRKSSAVLLIALVIAASVFTIVILRTYVLPRAITVPDNYQTIQGAINNANTGDTVYVRSGTFQVGELTIGKSIFLTGESPQKTIIQGQKYPFAGATIKVGAPDVTISGFTIRNCETAISVANYAQQAIPSNCKIIGNIITDNNQAIMVERSENFEIKDNTIINNEGGIGISSNGMASTGVISGNTISHNSQGVSIYSRYVTINDNTIMNNEEGLVLEWTGPYSIHDNKIIDNSIFGVNFGRGVSNTDFHNNEVDGNTIGIKLENFVVSGDAYIGLGNVVYSNNFVSNGQNALVETTYLNKNPTSVNGTDIVSWDNGKEGNYWSDYAGNGTHVIDQNNIDHHPLVFPAFIGITSFYLIIVVVVVLTVILVSLLLYRRRHKLSLLKRTLRLSMGTKNKNFAFMFLFLFFLSFLALPENVKALPEPTPNLNSTLTLNVTKVTDTTATLSWTSDQPPADFKSISGVPYFNNYILRMSNKTLDSQYPYTHSNYEDIWTTSDSQHNTTTLTNLSSSTKYYFYILASDYFGGEFSNIAEVQTLPSPTSTPTVAPSPSPTSSVLEFPAVAVLLLLLALFSVAVLLRHRKTNLVKKQLLSLVKKSARIGFYQLHIPITKHEQNQ
jgi:parallel beta-helix repeat protein